MFSKNKNKNILAPAAKAATRKETIPSIITKDMNILGNIVSDGNIDFDGTINGNIRCSTLTIRANATVTGEITAGTLHVYGKVKGLIRAKHVQFYATCHVDGVIMHETISIEDGAFVDGKFKRTDKPQTGSSDSDSTFMFEETSEEESSALAPKLLENIRLIR